MHSLSAPAACCSAAHRTSACEVGHAHCAVHQTCNAIQQQCNLLLDVSAPFPDPIPFSEWIAFRTRRYLLDEDEEDWAFDSDSTLTVGRNF